MTKSKQISFFEEEDNSFWEIKKHSCLVQMGGAATLLQRKLMDASIWITRDQLKRNPDQKIF